MPFPSLLFKRQRVALVYQTIGENKILNLHIHLHIYLSINLHIYLHIMRSSLLSFTTFPLPVLALYRVWQTRAQLTCLCACYAYAKEGIKEGGRGAGCWVLGDMGDGLPKQSAAINDKLDQQCQRQRERNCHTQSERDPQDHGTVVKGEGECGV